MNWLSQRIQRTDVLVGLFIAMVLLTWAFGYFRPLAGGTYLDSILSADESTSLLAALSAEQKRAHILVTSMLDFPYPFVYGFFFAGLTLRFFPAQPLIFAAPAFAVIPVDLLENTVQILALSDTGDLLVTKDVLTPLKFMLFILAMTIAVVALIRGVWMYLNRARAGPAKS